MVFKGPAIEPCGDAQGARAKAPRRAKRDAWESASAQVAKVAGLDDEIQKPDAACAGPTIDGLVQKA